MLIEIKGKQKALEELEKAQKLIDEASKILWKLPSEIKLELAEGNEKIIDPDLEKQSERR